MMWLGVWLNSSLAAANNFSSNLNRLLPLCIGIYMVISGHMTFGLIVAILHFAAPVLTFVTTLATTISGLQRSLAAGERVLNLLDTPPKPGVFSPLVWDR